jgi:hypothetical protein
VSDLIPLKGARTKQPNQATLVNWGNPITNKLIFAVNSAYTLKNLVTSDNATVYGSGLTLGVSIHGVHVSGVNGAGNNYRFPCVGSNQSYTVASLILDNGAQSVNRNPLDSDLVATPRVFQLRINNANKPEFIAFNTALSPAVATGASAQSTTKPFLLCGRVNNNVAEVFTDGVSVGSATITNTTQGLSSSSPLAIGGTLGIANQYFSGKIYLSLVWDRALSNAEIKSISDNPWQVFIPSNRNIYFDVVAGSGSTINSIIGDAVANGNSASILSSSTINGIIGNAYASSLTASLNTSLATTVGNSVADGFTVSLRYTINSTVGNALSDGFGASVDCSLYALTGNAVANGSNANIGSLNSISGIIGNSVADGFTATLSSFSAINCIIGNSLASGYSASINSVENTLVGNSTADGLAATISSSFTTLSAGDLAAISDAIGNRVIEGGYTFDEMMRIMFAALAGRRQGLGTTTERYMDVTTNKPRIVLTPDEYGNGTPIVDGSI